ncbi:MAG: HAMP domain-containing sensor histidine kinase, partial [Cellvibrionaceae bacterium]
DYAAGDKQVNYEFKGSWHSVPSDSQCLEMILSNLLSNSHRSIPHMGRISVDWGRAGQQWWLAVSDNGPGISRDEQEDIFKPFYQGSNTRKGPLKGSGMGLAIVRECVLRLSGSIELSSAANKATVFTLRFPLGDQHYHEAA